MYYCFESQCTVGRHSSSAGERGNHGYVKGKKQPENIAHFISNNEFFFHINFKRLGKRIVVLVENESLCFRHLYWYSSVSKDSCRALIAGSRTAPCVVGKNNSGIILILSVAGLSF